MDIFFRGRLLRTRRYKDQLRYETVRTATAHSWFALFIFLYSNLPTEAKLCEGMPTATERERSQDLGILIPTHILAKRDEIKDAAKRYFLA